MRQVLHKTTWFLLLLFPLLLLSHNDKPKGRYTKEKKIRREFQVNQNALLKVKNSYGNLNLVSWEENYILIEVHIQTNGNKEEHVTRKLNEISVEFENTSNLVSAVTRFDKSSSWWNFKGSNVNMQIDYTIKLPVKNSAHLSNDYGNIVLDRLDGHAKINCDYGRIDIGELHGRNNQLNFDYTTNSHIDFIHSGKIRADYSGFTIDKAGDIDLKADYTNASIIEIDNLLYSNDYGSLELGEVNDVKGSGDYFNIRLNKVHGDVDIDADYGGIKLKELAADAGCVSINSDYTSIKIGYVPEYSFDLEIEAEYTGVSGLDPFEIYISKQENSSRYYKGYHKTEKSGNTISIQSDYGKIVFNQN